ncbi:MAG: plastocyanin/azurin family copper-binding protein, partial [Gammaproteobacteria bacterium]
MALISGNVLADLVEVKAAATKFEPAVVFVKAGDTVKWSNMAAHDTVSLARMIPDGAQAWQSKMGEDFSVTLDAPGAYIYKCSPHVSLGMVGA